MIVTIEPGYYEDNNFGIRIENCVLTTKKLTKYQHLNIHFCQFEPLTYVPIQKELIDKKFLSQGELEWLNEYHEKCLKYIGPLLKERNKDDVYEWLIEQTKPL
jgi:Xaa-Pro aminopeptidase